MFLRARFVVVAIHVCGRLGFGMLYLQVRHLHEVLVAVIGEIWLITFGGTNSTGDSDGRLVKKAGF